MNPVQSWLDSLTVSNVPGSGASQERGEGLGGAKPPEARRVRGAGRADRPRRGASGRASRWPRGGAAERPRGTAVALWGGDAAADSPRRWEDESALAGFRGPQRPSLPPRRHPGALTELTLGCRPVGVRVSLARPPRGPIFGSSSGASGLLGLPSASRAGFALGLVACTFFPGATVRPPPEPGGDRRPSGRDQRAACVSRRHPRRCPRGLRGWARVALSAGRGPPPPSGIARLQNRFRTPP